MLPTARGAGAFAGRGAAHAVGDDDQVTLLFGELRLAFSGQAGLAHAHRLGEPGNQEMILVVAANLAAIGQGTELDRHPRRWDSAMIWCSLVESSIVGRGSWIGMVAVLCLSRLLYRTYMLHILYRFSPRTAPFGWR